VTLTKQASIEQVKQDPDHYDYTENPDGTITVTKVYLDGKSSATNDGFVPVVEPVEPSSEAIIAPDDELRFDALQQLASEAEYL